MVQIAKYVQDCTGSESCWMTEHIYIFVIEYTIAKYFGGQHGITWSTLFSEAIATDVISIFRYNNIFRQLDANRLMAMAKFDDKCEKIFHSFS
jgi:hypothetical protein